MGRVEVYRMRLDARTFFVVLVVLAQFLGSSGVVCSIRFCIRLRCPQPVPELFVDNAIIRVQHQGLLKALNQCTNLTDQILQLQTRLAEAVQDKENLIQVCRNDIALLGGIDTLVEFSDKK
jgi:hypothetical protein